DTFVSTLQRAGLHDVALRILRDGRQEHPADFWLNFTLGNVLASQRTDLEGALRFTTVAAALRPQSFSVNYTLALCPRDQGKVDEAVVVFRRAIELTPRDAPARAHLGLALRLQGNPAEAAAAALREALEIDPENPRYHYDLGFALREQTNAAGANAAF